MSASAPRAMQEVSYDTYLDYLPGISTITNIFILATKALSSCFSCTSFKNHSFCHFVEEKSITRCLIAAVPIVGNIIVALLDREKPNEKTDNENLRAITLNKETLRDAYNEYNELVTDSLHEFESHLKHNPHLTDDEKNKILPPYIEKINEAIHNFCELYDTGTLPIISVIVEQKSASITKKALLARELQEIALIRLDREGRHCWFITEVDKYFPGYKEPFAHFLNDHHKKMHDFGALPHDVTIEQLLPFLYPPSYNR